MQNNGPLITDNAHLLEEIFDKYQENPSSVDSQWSSFFNTLPLNGSSPSFASQGSEADYSSLADLGILNLLNTYRSHGHRAASLDPLKIHNPDRSMIDEKTSAIPADDRSIKLDSVFPGFDSMTLGEVIDHLEKTYCGTIGFETAHIGNDDERQWLREKIESAEFLAPIPEYTKIRLFEKLFQADFFERFLAKKYVGKKRFSLEGGESAIPLLDTVIEESAKLGMTGLVFGMAHRGRLNVLENIMEKPASQIFAEFEENYDPETIDYADVKYHLGYTKVRTAKNGSEIKLSLMFNPSHLEAVNPVVLGSVRARQALAKDTERSKVMGILIHGDAAFPGQGVVSETINLMKLNGYDTGGTLHLVVNNQIGFTTLPNESRSTMYSTDIAKGFQIPIFHVNGDDTEAVYRVAKLAIEYRQIFKKDVIIDLVCYRRLGHNEMDEPSFTQPVMYDVIKKHQTTAQIYEKLLRDDKEFADENIDFIKKGSQDGLEESFKDAHEKDVRMKVDTMQGVWAKYTSDATIPEPTTKLLKDQMARVVKSITSWPSSFTPHPKLVRLLEQRQKMYDGDLPIDWGFAEHLALGSILENGTNIRFAGQDAQRGTFSHRHAVLNDIKTNEMYCPLNDISNEQGELEIINSPLSEYSVLGYEYGYSLSNPNSMVIWEAQFGDFANTAQVIIDQFLSSSEVKWHRMSGLVMLLPHGYEGQGPEHSSARLERYLQLCALNNMIIANCTTPAQYFHLLRRQVFRKFKKPLVVFTPKSLLRLPEAISTLDDLELGSFRKVLWDKEIDADKVDRLLFCSGKVYYDLQKRRSENTAILRLEQLYPFPEDQIKEALAHYSKAKVIKWVQEEPINMGSWLFIEDRLKSLLPKGVELGVSARGENPSPASGLAKIHTKELDELMNSALNA